MGAWGGVGRDFLQMKVHGGAVADGQDETGLNPSSGANGTEIGQETARPVWRESRPIGRLPAMVSSRYGG